jgi:hypothetical protein
MNRRPATLADLESGATLFWARFAKAASNGNPGAPVGSYQWMHVTTACQSGVMVTPNRAAAWDLGWFEVEVTR